MTTDQPDEPAAGIRPDRPGPGTGAGVPADRLGPGADAGGTPATDRHASRTAIIGAAVISGLAVGWFALSYLVMGTPAGDAAGEALGVGFALLVLASIIGAVRSGRGNHP